MPNNSFEEMAKQLLFGVAKTAFKGALEAVLGETQETLSEVDKRITKVRKKNRGESTDEQPEVVKPKKKKKKKLADTTASNTTATTTEREKP